MPVSAFKLDVEGVELHAEAYWAEGRARGGDGYVLFLHGGGPTTSSEGMRYLREDLAARGIASVALDFSGHGRSGGRMEDASLARRRAEALRLVDSLHPARPRAIVATSMAGHVACRLVPALRPDALVLFCPAAYEANAEEALFGESFRAVIRATRGFDGSLAFTALRVFKGRVLCFYGSEDEVIPQAVQQGYAKASVCATSADLRTLNGAGHKLHDWISARPALRREVVDRIMATLGFAPA